LSIPSFQSIFPFFLSSSLPFPFSLSSLHFVFDFQDLFTILFLTKVCFFLLVSSSFDLYIPFLLTSFYFFFVPFVLSFHFPLSFYPTFLFPFSFSLLFTFFFLPFIPFLPLISFLNFGMSAINKKISQISHCLKIDLLNKLNRNI